MGTVEIKNELHKLIDAGDVKFLRHLYEFTKSYEGPLAEDLPGVLEEEIEYKRKLTLHLPFPLDLVPEEAKMAFASKLYELGKISLGQGAELVGCTKKSFMFSLADFGVSIFNYPPEDLDQDLENASNYSI